MRLLLILLLLLPQAAFAQIKVVASIKPLTLIIKEIGGDRIILEQLIPDQASHHDYPLKMSDHRRLHQADLVVWIGSDLESFLTRPLSNLSKEKILSLTDLSDIEWPEDNEDSHDHHHNRDPHLWLNPQNVIAIVKCLTKKMSALDQKNAAEFQNNAHKFIASLEILDQKTEKELLPLHNQGFAVYHHGYSHYVEHYGLKQLGYLTLTPERKTGAKNLSQLLNLLKKEGKCIFAEPFVDDSQVLAIANKHQLRVGYLDLMGIKSDNYQQLMQSITDSFLTCLSDGRR